jgi:hypothetical protein
MWTCARTGKNERHDRGSPPHRWNFSVSLEPAPFDGVLQLVTVALWRIPGLALANHTFAGAVIIPLRLEFGHLASPSNVHVFGRSTRDTLGDHGQQVLRMIKTSAPAHAL